LIGLFLGFVSWVHGVQPRIPTAWKHIKCEAMNKVMPSGDRSFFAVEQIDDERG